jgi:hypothetical protein
LKTRLPVRSALFKQRTGGLVVRWVTTGESPLLNVFVFCTSSSDLHAADTKLTNAVATGRQCGVFLFFFQEMGLFLIWHRTNSSASTTNFIFDRSHDAHNPPSARNSPQNRFYAEIVSVFSTPSLVVRSGSPLFSAKTSVLERLFGSKYGSSPMPTARLPMRSPSPS